MATIKQRDAIKTIVENRGMAVSKAMEAVGYAKKTAKNPKNLTESKGWDELMEEYFPDSLLAKKQKQFLNSRKEEIGIKALDLGYKLKGKYVAEKREITGKDGTPLLILPSQLIDKNELPADRSPDTSRSR